MTEGGIVSLRNFLRKNEKNTCNPYGSVLLCHGIKQKGQNALLRRKKEVNTMKEGIHHISEISYTFINNIHDVLQEGQSVRVKVLGTDEKGKISLSVKKAQERKPAAPAAPVYRPPVKAAPQTFEEKLKQFMSDSDSKISGCRQYEHRTKSRKR